MPVEVSAFSATLAHPIEAEDTIVASLRFRHGALGVIEAATSAWPGVDLRIEVNGDRGAATLVNDRLVRWEFAGPQPEDAAVLAPAAGPEIKSGASSAGAMSGEGHRLLIADLTAALRERRAPMIPGAEARNAVALVMAIYESARTGKPARVG